MNLTHCPVCSTRVHATHRCQGRPVELTPMPPEFRDLVAAARVEARVEQPPLFDEGEE